MGKYSGDLLSSTMLEGHLRRTRKQGEQSLCLLPVIRGWGDENGKTFFTNLTRRTLGFFFFLRFWSK